MNIMARYSIFFLSLQLINNIILYGVELRISDYRPKKLES